MGKKSKLRIAIGLFIFAIILLFCLIEANAEGWTENYSIPSSDTDWTVSTDKDTLHAKWDYDPEIFINWYILYATVVDTSEDSIHWNGNYTEKIEDVDVGTDGTYGSVITLHFEKGYYMCQLSAVKDEEISVPSDPVWLKVTHTVLVPKNFRLIIIKRQNATGCN